MSCLSENISPQVRLLKLLSIHERALSSYYSACSNAFSEFEEFWRTLSLEEMAHGDVVDRLITSVDNGELEIDTALLECSVVEKSIKQLADRARSVESGDCGMLAAMQYGMETEKTMIDRCFFSLMTPKTVGMEREFALLADHTVEHMKRLQQQLKQSMHAQLKSAKQGEVELVLASMEAMHHLVVLFMSIVPEYELVWKSSADSMAEDKLWLSQKAYERQDSEHLVKVSIIQKDQLRRLDEVIEWEMNNAISEGVKPKRALKIASELEMLLQNSVSEEVEPPSMLEVTDRLIERSKDRNVSYVETLSRVGPARE